MTKMAKWPNGQMNKWPYEQMTKWPDEDDPMTFNRLFGVNVGIIFKMCYKNKFLIWNNIFKHMLKIDIMLRFN